LGTANILGDALMLAGLSLVFCISFAGANEPSGWVESILCWIECYLTAGVEAVNAPAWLHGGLVLGLYRGTSGVISVMLPPMMIFFPVFALLENFGYLPRVAFNMDRLFKKSGGHGKQALTMSMGFGCNPAAILPTRLIDSPRERTLPILTNNFVPRNGRRPTLILLSSFFHVARAAPAALRHVPTALALSGHLPLGLSVTLPLSLVMYPPAPPGVPP
ncbi:iron transporter FeoB, partial [Paenibacillus riograndensis]